MRVVVCGLTTVDLIQTVERAPGPNEKASSTSAVLDVGGPAANAARAAAALGVRPVLVSPIGPGLFGRLAREWLEDAGVAVVDLAEDGDPSISAVTLDAAGNRSVVSSNNTGRRHGFPPPDVLDGAAALLVDGHLLDVQIAMARTALGLGLPVVLDGGSFKRGIAGLLPHVTHGVLSADFHLPDVDDGLLLETLAWKGMRLAAQSNGERPIEAIYDGRSYSIEVPRVDVVDTLGAGDVLHGAFLAGLAQGSEPLAALRAAAEAASSSVAASGVMGWAGQAATKP